MVRQAQPLHTVAAVGASVVLVASASQSIRDADIWWHATVGAEIIDRRTVKGLGNSWAPFGDQDWVTTQWLPEVLYSVLVAKVGWDGVSALRLFANALTVGLLAAVVLNNRPARVTVPVYVLSITGLTPFLIQDRPQTLTLALAPLLASMVTHWLREDRPPRVWIVFALTLVWANIHGSWVLVPAMVGLVTLGRLADGSPCVAVLQQGLRLGVVSLLAGLLTPATWHSLVAIIRFSERTDLLTEWQPTMPAALYALAFALLVAGLLWSWARSPRVPRSEMIVGLGLITFGMLANRNIPYAIILLAPLVAARLADMYPERLAVGRTEAALLAGFSTVVVASGLGLVVAVHQATDAVERAAPIQIAASFAMLDQPARVLNTYGAAGVLVEFSGGNVELGIDGRADRYPLEYTTAYLDAVSDLTDWQALVEQVDPDFAVLHGDEALATHLAGQGWRVQMRDADFVLLAPGGAE